MRSGEATLLQDTPKVREQTISTPKRTHAPERPHVMLSYYLQK